MYICGLQGIAVSQIFIVEFGMPPIHITDMFIMTRGLFSYRCVIKAIYASDVPAGLRGLDSLTPSLLISDPSGDKNEYKSASKHNMALVSALCFI